MGRLIFVSVCAYLLGSISFTFLMGRLVARLDLSRHGSGNLGGTNAVRVLGWIPGLIAGLCDVGKGWLAVTLARAWGGNTGLAPALAFLAVSVGHNWSVFFLGQKGGKGISTTIGGSLALAPVAALAGLFFALEIVLLSRLVSLASLLFVTMLPAGLLLTHARIEVFIASLILAGMAFYRHRGNIVRLWRGEERRLGERQETVCSPFTKI